MAGARAVAAPVLIGPPRQEPLDPAIRVERLSRRFGPVLALANADLEVPRGTITGLLGPNGAGKTTMLRILLGLIAPDAGRVEVLGRDPIQEGTAVRAACGAVFEHDGLYERLSGRENLEFHARIRRLPDRAERVREGLARADLEAHGERPAGDYSRGMRRRLAMARALLHEPALLLLDEPSAGLDPRARAVMHDQLAGLAAAGRTIVLATHDLAEAESLCSAIVVLHAGRVVASGATDEPRAASDVIIRGRGLGDVALRSLARAVDVVSAEIAGDEAIRLRLTVGATPTSAIAALLRAGVEIEEVRRERPSIETVFLALTGDATR
jgi:ABC-2 type transport system ATP-binding protein